MSCDLGDTLVAKAVLFTGVPAGAIALLLLFFVINLCYVINFVNKF